MVDCHGAALKYAIDLLLPLGIDVGISDQIKYEEGKQVCCSVLAGEQKGHHVIDDHIVGGTRTLKEMYLLRKIKVGWGTDSCSEIYSGQSSSQGEHTAAHTRTI